MKRWSKCWRRVVNRGLAQLLKLSDWHAYVAEKGDKSSQSKFRWLRFSRDGEVLKSGVKPETCQLRRGSFGWLFCNATNPLALTWTLMHDAEDTVVIHFSLPWLCGFYLTLDIGYLNWIKARVGEYGEARYGFEIDRRGIELEWCNAEDQRRTVFHWVFGWDQIHGKPVVTTTTSKPVEVMYVQPAGGEFASSSHLIQLIYRTTHWKWPRFWKPDVRVSGFEVALEEPPAIPAKGIARAVGRKTDGIYGTFIRDVLGPADAVQRYREMVHAARV